MEQNFKGVVYMHVITKDGKNYDYYCSEYNNKYGLTNTKKGAYVFTNKGDAEKVSKEYISNKEQYGKLFSDWINEPCTVNCVIIEEL